MTGRACMRIVVVIALAMICCIIANNCTSQPVFGRDTVKVLADGAFYIVRSAETYSLYSSDGQISIYDITHYYYENGTIYLKRNADLYICVDTTTNHVESHSETAAFDQTIAEVFSHTSFCELPVIKPIQSIWDILRQ